MVDPRPPASSQVHSLVASVMSNMDFAHHLNGHNYEASKNSFATTSTRINDPAASRHRRRTADDFLLFCEIVLDYTKYDEIKQQELRRRYSSSPSLGSTGSGNESLPHSSSTGATADLDEMEADDRYHIPAMRSSKRRNLIGMNGNSDGNKKRKSNVSQKGVDADEEDDDEDEDDDDEDEEVEEEVVDNDWDQVTCYCGKPFAGRPMVECSHCLTWIHLKCAKLTRRRIPDVWFCQKCKHFQQPPQHTSHKSVKKISTESRGKLSVSQEVVSVVPEKVIGSRKRKMTSRRQRLSTTPSGQSDSDFDSTNETGKYELSMESAS